MPPRGRQGRRRLGLITLITLAVAAWGGAAAIDAANLDDHLWWISFGAGMVSSLAAIQWGLVIMLAGLLGGVNDRLDKAYNAMAALYCERPGPELAVTPPPWRALRSVGGADDAPARPASPR